MISGSGYGGYDGRGGHRRRRGRRMTARVIIPLAVPMALGLALGMVLALSGNSVITTSPTTTGTPVPVATSPVGQPAGGGISQSPWPTPGSGTPWWQPVP